MGDEEHVALPQGSEHVVGDGLRVLVRPLVAADRAELAAGYRKLSSRSRHTRFFAPPDELDEDDLDYLTLLDYDDHYALAAFALDAPGRPGIGVARYVRERDRPSHAEVAVTVLDGYQRRGLGTLLMRLLASIAVTHGVSTFVYYAQWENEEMIEELRAEGARVSPDEAGVARIELDLPGGGDELGERTVHQITRTLARRLRDVFERVQSTAGPAHEQRMASRNSSNVRHQTLG
jgi:GNAT superfamily N-acetyltransferase